MYTSPLTAVPTQPSGDLGTCRGAAAPEPRKASRPNRELRRRDGRKGSETWNGLPQEEHGMAQEHGIGILWQLKYSGNQGLTWFCSVESTGETAGCSGFKP